MQYHIVTTFHQAGYEKYGRNMIESFDRHWPQNVWLTVYHEHECPDISSDRITYVSLHDRCPDLVKFKNAHKDNPNYNGMRMKDGSLDYTANHFKWDAVRFSNKVYCVADAVTNIDSDWVIWLDADTFTFRSVPDGFLDTICPNQYLACYLGRRNGYHSECGWVAYNRTHNQTQNFIDEWKALYDSGELFTLREYHDSYVFDVMRIRYEEANKAEFYNLFDQRQMNGPGHPFINSALGRYIDHMKGKRKDQGHSNPGEQQTHQDVEYWSNI